MPKRCLTLVKNPAIKAVEVRGYLSEAELVASIMGCFSEGEYYRALDRARRNNEQPRLVRLLGWSKGFEYAMVQHAIFTDMVKIVNVSTQRLLVGTYDQTSFPIEEGKAKLLELGAVNEM